MLIASTDIYTRSRRQKSNILCHGITVLIGVFVPHGMSADRRWRNWGCGALSVMDVPTATWFVANREAATSRQASVCWTSLSQVCTRSTASSIARRRTASVSASRRFCTLEMRLILGRSGSRAAFRIFSMPTVAVEPRLDLRPFVLTAHGSARYSSAGTRLRILPAYCCTNAVSVGALLSPRLRSAASRGIYQMSCSRVVN